jgi:hypothetical protein
VSQGRVPLSQPKEALSAEKRRELSGPTADIHDTRIWREIHVTHGSPPFLAEIQFDGLAQNNSDARLLGKFGKKCPGHASVTALLRTKFGEVPERGDHALKIKEL